MSGAALDADLVVRRGTPGGQQLLVRARLRVEPGEVLALVGPSAAGKSTILAAIAGTVGLESGTIAIGSRIVSDHRHRVAPASRGVVALDQDARLFPHLSAAENVAFGLRARGMPRREARERASDWLERVGLAGLGDRAPAQLSGGQQQRVALARALAIDPALLLLDEPFTSLDVETAAAIRAVVREQLDASGTTAVVVTHAAVDAEALASRVAIVEAGSIVQQGRLAEVLSAPATRFAAAFAEVHRLEGAVRGMVWTGPSGLRLPAPGIADGPVAAVFRPAGVRLVPTTGHAPQQPRDRSASPLP